MATEAQHPEMPCMKMTIGNSRLKDKIVIDDTEKDVRDTTESALASFTDKEEEIELKKTEMRDKIRAQLCRVEEEAKRLVGIRGEVDAVSDPMRKEAEAICKKVDLVTRELKHLGIQCQKKEKEYKEAVEALNEKNKERAELVTKLDELVSQSDKLRLQKLEELCKNI